ncbi:MAG: type II secretion system F family protein [Thermoleophilia bacterium]
MTGVIPAVIGGAGGALAALGLTAPRRGGTRGSRGSGHGAALVAPLSIRLVRAGIPADARLVAAATAAAAVLLAATAWLLRGSAPLALVGLVLPPAAAGGIVRHRMGRYPDRVAAQLPAALRAVADGLAAGRSLRGALARAASDSPQPLAAELEAVVDQLALGGRLDDALADLSRRCPRPALQIMNAAVLVSASSGGNLARILGELSERLEGRRRLERELRGLGAQARATAWMVAALPMVGAVAVEAVAPGVLARTLLRGPGVVSLVIATALMAAATLLVRRIGDVA